MRATDVFPGARWDVHVSSSSTLTHKERMSCFRAGHRWSARCLFWLTCMWGRREEERTVYRSVRLSRRRRLNGTFHCLCFLSPRPLNCALRFLSHLRRQLNLKCNLVLNGLFRVVFMQEAKSEDVTMATDYSLLFFLSLFHRSYQEFVSSSPTRRPKDRWETRISERSSDTNSSLLLLVCRPFSSSLFHIFVSRFLLLS